MSIFIQSFYQFHSRSKLLTKLIAPMERRFQYHFFTEQRTNDLSKPEWFFTQILNWIIANIDLISAILLQIFKDKVTLIFFILETSIFISPGVES